MGVLSLFFFISVACLWDSDTIEMENRQFPGTLELITGKFLRHSNEFHEWRIKDRLQRIALHPDSLHYYNDLAVSYSKLKRDKEAIEVMKKKNSLQPGKYETYANMGTFYIHDGDLKNGIKYINKALEINPEAHFGRERYQKYLAEYLLTKWGDGERKYPLINNNEFLEPFRENDEQNAEQNFRDFLLAKLNANNLIDTVYQSLPESELLNARKGIEGMMKFGNFDSPVLLEVLADVLSNSMWQEAPRHLLALCYYNASLNTNDSIATKKYLDKIDRVKGMIEVENENWINDQTKILDSYNKVGREYLKKIRNNELKWIADSSLNPEVEFAKYYYKKDISTQYPLLTKDSDSIKPISLNLVEEPKSSPAGYNQLFMFGFLILGAILVVWKFRNNS